MLEIIAIFALAVTIVVVIVRSHIPAQGYLSDVQKERAAWTQQREQFYTNEWKPDAAHRLRKEQQP